MLVCVCVCACARLLVWLLSCLWCCAFLCLFGWLLDFLLVPRVAYWVACLFVFVVCLFACVSGRVCICLVLCVCVWLIVCVFGSIFLLARVSVFTCVCLCVCVCALIGYQYIGWLFGLFGCVFVFRSRISVFCHGVWVRAYLVILFVCCLSSFVC